jgi:cell division septation protein DedD
MSTIRKPRPKLHVRLPAVVAGGVIAGVVLLGVVAGGGPSYGGAIRAQRRAVTRDATIPQHPRGGGDVHLCARGATGYASAAAAAAGAPLRRSDGVVEPTVLAAMSSAAIEAGRWAEIGAGGPALPRRMGLDGGAVVAPPELRCDNAPAFAQARVSARPALPATPPPPVRAPKDAAKPTKAKAKKPTPKPSAKPASKPRASTTPR